MTRADGSATVSPWQSSRPGPVGIEHEGVAPAQRAAGGGPRRPRAGLLDVAAQLRARLIRPGRFGLAGDVVRGRLGAQEFLRGGGCDGAGEGRERGDRGGAEHGWFPPSGCAIEPDPQARPWQAPPRALPALGRPANPASPGVTGELGWDRTIGERGADRRRSPGRRRPPPVGAVGQSFAKERRPWIRTARPCRLRSRDRARHRRRGAPPGRRRRDDPVGELHLPRGAGLRWARC